MSKKTEAKVEKNSESKIEEKGQERQMPKINWDQSKMDTTYANVCNVSSSREEVTLLFGTNQPWRASKQGLNVELKQCLILNPFAAKRLSILLGNVIREYESRFEEINISREAEKPASK
jgi:hypothetical protein